MKTVIMAGFLILALSGCNQKPEAATENENQEENAEGGLTSVVLTAQQFNALGMKVDTLSKRNFQAWLWPMASLRCCPRMRLRLQQLLVQTSLQLMF